VDLERQPGSNAIAKLAIERTIEGINRDFCKPPGGGGLDLPQPLWGAGGAEKGAHNPEQAPASIPEVQPGCTGCRPHPGCTDVSATHVKRDVEYSRGAEHGPLRARAPEGPVQGLRRARATASTGAGSAIAGTAARAQGLPFRSAYLHCSTALQIDRIALSS
jgi:hypothetical protein